MKVNFLYQRQPGTWAEHYAELLLPFLREDYAVTALELPESQVAREAALGEAPPADVWMSWCITEWLTREIVGAAKGSPVIGHLHGGFENRSVEGMGMAGEDSNVEEDFAWCLENVAAVMVNSESHARQLREYWGPRLKATVYVTGFPVDMYGYEGERPRAIVVPGRVSDDKQVILAAQILEPWMDRTTFCQGSAAGREGYLSSVLRGWGYRVVQVQGRQYHAELEKASVAFTASYMDTLNVSMVEAAQSGCCLVAPDLPVFREYVPDDYRYRPFDIADARAKIAKALEEKDWVAPYVDRYRPAVVYSWMQRAIESVRP